MRTTLTLDDAIADRLAELARESHRPFRDVVNETLRKGLGESGPAQPKFVVRPHPGSLRPGIDDGRLNELIWDLEQGRVSEPPPSRPRPRRDSGGRH